MPLSDDRRLLLERLIRQGAPAVPDSAPSKGPRIEPASYAQRRLWFLEQIQQTEVPYTLHAVQHLEFSISPPLLERALNEIVRRHEVLRTSFLLQDDEPVQIIAGEAVVTLRVVDLSGLPVPERRAEALRQMSLTIARRFDLERGPLLRTELYRLAEQESLFLLAAHHIVFDGPSFQIFFKELEAVYGALVGNRQYVLPKVSARYAEFAREQRTKLTPQRISEEVKFWRAELASVPMLDLPTDRRRSPVPTFRGGQKQVEVSPALVTKLQRRAALEKTTLFTIILAGFCAALSRICGQEDFAVGVPVTGRDTAERQDAIGFFVDTVVVRARLHGDPSTSELIEAIRATVNRTLSHRSLPFEMLVQHLQPERDLGVNPFFQASFQLMLHPAVTGESGALDIARSSAMFDLGLDLWMQAKGVSGRLQFNTDLFDPPTVDLILAAFSAALEWLVRTDQRLSDLSLGNGRDSPDVSILHGAEMEFAQRSCVELVAEVAQRYADVPALEARNECFTYGELMNQSAQLGSALQKRGARPGSLIALELGRSLELSCLQLATWQVGSAFVYMDPAWPRMRREQILEDARPQLVIDAAELATLYRELEAQPLSGWPARSDPAYVIFTSGSTGQPKGVLIEHAGLLNVAQAQRQLFGLTPGRRVAQLASPTFDASIFETVLAFASGATLVIAPPEILAGEELAQFLDQNNIDTVVLPPTVLATVEPSMCPSLRLVCVAGENCPCDLAQRWGEGREFWNLYGPTEATIWATYGRKQLGSKVSIGRPISNLTTVVIDRSCRAVPVGVAGELCISGMGLARGYLNRPELTAERFVTYPSTFNGRLYRTGDLVRQTHSGELVFLGRVDRQVKVRGFRIEPEEIETVLRSHSLVSEVVVGARSTNGSEPMLIAYLQCKGDADEITEACRRLVRERLPQHMSPSRFVVLKEFPRTSSGKIDVQALPAPSEPPGSDDRYIEPSTPTERRVAELMARSVRVSRVGAADDFFRIGGHSLAAAQFVARARAAFNADLKVRDVFLYPTVSALALRINELTRQREGVEEVDDVPLVRLPRKQESR